MSIKEIASRIEEAEYQALRIKSLEAALEQAIYNGEHAETEYEWAFNVLGGLAHDLAEELHDITYKAFELTKGKEGR